MTDLEMTRLCAEAVGYGQCGATNDGKIEVVSIGENYVPRNDGLLSRPIVYDPLNDDAQAMALVKKLNISPTRGAYGWIVWPSLDNGECALNKDLNRAIVECVAKMQEAK